MKQQQPRAIFFDLDGTLCVTRQKPSEKTLLALGAARAKGCKLFLCTGRAPSLIPASILALGWDGVIAGLGAHITANEKLLLHAPYSPAEIAALRQHLSDRGVIYLLEGESEAFMDLEGFRALNIGELQGINEELADLHAMVSRSQIRDLREYRCEEIFNVVLLCADDPRLACLRRELEDRYRLAVHPAAQKGLLTDVELIRKSVNKGQALALTCQAFGVAQEDSIAFGDSMNDYEMLIAAGIGVAMGNADEETRSHADWVCPAVEDEGIYQAMEHFGLL